MSAILTLFQRPIRFGYIFAASSFGVTTGLTFYIWPKTPLYAIDLSRAQERKIARAQAATTSDELLKYLRGVDRKLSRVHDALGLVEEAMPEPEDAIAFTQEDEIVPRQSPEDQERVRAHEEWLRQRDASVCRWA